MRITEIFASFKKSGSRNATMTSDFRPEVEIWPFRARDMHPAIIIGTLRSLCTWLWGRYHVRQNVFLVYFMFLCTLVSLSDSQPGWTYAQETPELQSKTKWHLFFLAHSVQSGPEKNCTNLMPRHFGTVCIRITRFSPLCSAKITVYQSMQNLYQLVKYSLINSRYWIHGMSNVTLHVNMTSLWQLKIDC